MTRADRLIAGALIAGLTTAASPAQVPSAETPAAASVCAPGSPADHPMPRTAQQWAAEAKLFDGLGDFHRKIATSVPQAQQFFDQGMRYLWAFNHDEATRSFAKAAQLDPQCAACYWGVALTVGPNYNLPMMVEARAKVAWEALQKAKELAPQAAPVEQALIAALAERYPSAQPLDPSNAGPALTAYSRAMKEAAQSFPDDDDVQTLYAEAMMNINAWKLWSLEGEPAPGTEEIVATLEKVLARNPEHPGANHYYIHAVEASPSPGRAVAAAEKLPGMMPAAGHLEHMPAHIMQRVGHYREAAAANRSGIAADLAYFTATKAPDYYVMYTAHNYQFLAFSAAMEGRKAEALEAAEKSLALVPDEMLSAMPGTDWYAGELYQVLIRFGLWDRILGLPAPKQKLLGLISLHRYARTTALAATGRIDEAKAELAALKALAGSIPDDYGAGLNRLGDVVAVALLNAKARIAIAEKHDVEALTLLREAVAKEDQLAYAEPADWFFPTRHLLGAVLIRSGQAAEAEAVYREDLRRNSDNGWAFYGLYLALNGQGKGGDATATKQQFDQAWARADTTLMSSAF